MLELLKLQDHHVYKFLKFKYLIKMDRKLHKEDQLQLHHNGQINKHLVKQLMEMLEQEAILKFSILDLNNVNKLITEIIFIGKLIYKLHKLFQE